MGLEACLNGLIYSLTMVIIYIIVEREERKKYERKAGLRTEG